MAAELTANLTVKYSATYLTAHDLNTTGHDVKNQFVYEKNFAITNGTTANKADQLFEDRRTLSASANEDLDLAGGLTDAFGTTLTFVRINMVIVFALSANTNDVEVSRAASNGVPLFSAASDKIPLPPGGLCVLYYGDDATDVVVTAGTGDLLNIANSSSGTGVTYDVIIMGASA